ncbi:ATP-grasp domain-containing protein [Salisediminibacterium halotolerans]|uniref:ATP-grasp domain-containing protein n=1 Tax=Salisediminibacterium halotolerans TaxID=517425 RepID=UPI000EB21C7F|nr:hypothetical protein [Salisediminibacterium halotolerans]RLJ78239.1 ribosomal protein S6--L-glutamate ligase/gamma-F420-2:alpha-L-glutamate ligase [Actinophytocola xinjiangensis]RPE88422.1 ribosomal protein S6--L-glutamate ligase/gamma-F420-2:alpha-L-glutamate ligase [Salisediminibacterium halotolerans]TWG37216.1 ribosomal protein S6--L-glutamate ligase/gamma-F420-2:alpha-L-glutamate ligase [Salisediminibacterium halotolerans]GEL07150.1 hypothetical protein SHA02_05660 [Salisediminibacterium
MNGRKGWLVYREKDIARNRRFIDLLEDAAKKYALDLTVKPYESIDFQLTAGNAGTDSNSGVSPPAFIINRAVAPWLNEAAEVMGIRCYNRANIARIANDKRLAHAHLHQLGVPMLPTRACSLTQVLDERTNQSIIAKDPLGRGGTGVKLLNISDSPASIRAALPKQVIEQPVGGQPGKDLRVYIVGGKIIAAVLRESSTDFRANISQGGSSKLVELTAVQRQIVEKITSAFQLDFVGLDFLLDKNGHPLFNEMEDAVGCRSLYIAGQDNIADVVMAHIASDLAT